MTDCNCVCSTFGPGPHDAEARHPNPKACEHAEYPEPPRTPPTVSVGRFEGAAAETIIENVTWRGEVPHG